MSYLRDSTFNYVITKKKVGILFGWFWDVAKRQIIIYMSFADSSKLNKLSYSSQYYKHVDVELPHCLIEELIITAEDYTEFSSSAETRSRHHVNW